jgi:hypothetical protein
MLYPATDLPPYAFGIRGNHLSRLLVNLDNYSPFPASAIILMSYLTQNINRSANYPTGGEYYPPELCPMQINLHNFDHTTMIYHPF